MLPMQSVDLAIDEMRYAREALGMRGGFLRPNPYHGNKMISDPMYEPFWTMAEELDFSIGFHEGSTNAMPTVGVDRFEGDRAARHMISHTMEMMLAAMSVIWGGVVDRHPRLRIAFLESGGGWIAPWLDRMDRHFDDQGFNDTAPKIRPSELFQRNCWISFEPVENSIAVLADYIGPHRSCGRLIIRIRTDSSRERTDDPRADRADIVGQHGDAVLDRLERDPAIALEQLARPYLRGRVVEALVVEMPVHAVEPRRDPAAARFEEGNAQPRGRSTTPPRSRSSPPASSPSCG